MQPSHRRQMLANLACSVLEHGRVKTTEAKAKEVRPLAEKVITVSKKGDLHSRRKAIRLLRNKDISYDPVSYTHLRAHETDSYLVCRLLLENKKTKDTATSIL